MLQSLRPIAGDAVDTTVVRAQYVAGFDLGAPVPGYRAEQGVAPDSRTETFVALQAVHRQLALGRRAVLPAHRQAAAEARQRDLAST